jgi:glycosyltransferase involved in cell wall biosynthesis
MAQWRSRGRRAPDWGFVTQGILYISYDGMLEPLGQSQVLTYLERLSSGREIHLLSFEKAADWSDRERRQVIERRTAASGIHWHPLRYHKSPSAAATAYDVSVGIVRAISLVFRHRLSVVHARSYVPSLIALAVKRATGAKFLFDMRGFWANERVDGGLWPENGFLYRTAKRFEARFLRAANYVVTLTHASQSEIRRFGYLAGRVPPIAVIPTCADLERFTIQGPPQREPFVLGYVGSVGTWYLLDDMLRFYRELRLQRPGARLLIANRGEQPLVRTRLAALGIDQPDVEITAANHQGMPGLIARMTAGMALIKPCFSKIASAPTKLAEYLGCGVPCVGNVGVGDMEEILRGREVGVALDNMSEAAIREGVGQLLQLASQADLQRRCRMVAEELFSVDAAVASYDSIYRQLDPA